MKTLMKTTIALVLVVAVGLLAVMVLGICGVISPFSAGEGNLRLANRQVFSTEGLASIVVEYPADTVEILPGAVGEVVLEEYMSRAEEARMASAQQAGNVLSISAGERPWMMGWFSWRCKVKLYIPETLAADLRISTQSGSIESEGTFALASLAAQSKSGSVHLGRVQATGDIRLSASSGSIQATALLADGEVSLSASSGSVRVDTISARAVTAKAQSGSLRFGAVTAETVAADASSGGVSFEQLNGNFTLRAQSGSVKVESGEGAGSAEASSGSVNITLNALSGDVSLASKSGGCKLYLPEGSTFALHAQTGSGGLHLPEGGNMSYSQNGHEASGAFGRAPQHEVRLEASSGSVRLEWA